MEESMREMFDGCTTVTFGFLQQGGRIWEL